ncbi:MAG: hypothetical protein QXL57_02140 [Candidatus Bathyarchaeia archaeon]
MFGFITYKLTYQLFIFTIKMKVNRQILMLIHTLGLSCLGGAIFLQILVFTDILQHGYFMAIENNPAILSLEIILTAFAVIYFIYIYQRLIRSIK